jgi:hypothetical protein
MARNRVIWIHIMTTPTLESLAHDFATIIHEADDRVSITKAWRVFQREKLQHVAPFDRLLVWEEARRLLGWVAPLGWEGVEPVTGEGE